LRAEGFSFSLDVILGGLEISKLQFLIKKGKFLVIKTLDPEPDPESLDMLDPDPDSLDMLDPDPDSMNPDLRNNTDRHNAYWSYVGYMSSLFLQNCSADPDLDPCCIRINFVWIQIRIHILDPDPGKEKTRNQKS
jgi:hypothetical protein